MGTIDIGKYPDEVKDIFGNVNGTPSIKDTIKWQFFGKIIKIWVILYDLSVQFILYCVILNRDKIALPDRTDGGLFSSIEDYNGPIVSADIVTEALTVHLQEVLAKENSRRRRSIIDQLMVLEQAAEETTDPDWLIETDIDIGQVEYLL